MSTSTSGQIAGYTAAFNLLQASHRDHQVAVEEVVARRCGDLVTYLLDGRLRQAVIKAGSIIMDRPQGKSVSA